MNNPTPYLNYGPVQAITSTMAMPTIWTGPMPPTNKASITNEPTEGDDNNSQQHLCAKEQTDNS